MSVSYTVNGSVSYEVSGVYVNINTTLYMSTLTTLTGDSSLGSKVSEFETQLKSNGSASVSDTAKHSYNYEYASYSEESGFNAETTPKSDNIPINYGSYIEDQTAYAYYIIVKIENIAENKINAVLDLGDTSMLNSYVKPNMTQTNIDANSTQYFVIGMSLKDATIGVNETFNYHFTITPGELQEPTLYQQTYTQVVENPTGFMLSSYDDESSAVDIAQNEFLLQNMEYAQSWDMFVAMQNLKLDISESSIQNLSSMTLNVSTQSSFMMFFVFGKAYSKDDITSAINSAIQGDSTNLLGSSVYAGSDSFDVTIKSGQLSTQNSADICVVLLSMDPIQPVSDLTLKLTSVSVTSETANSVKIGEIPVDTSLVVSANNSILFDVSYEGTKLQAQVFNFKITNFYPKEPFIVMASALAADGIMVTVKGNFLSSDTDAIFNIFNKLIQGEQVETLLPISNDDSWKFTQEIYDNYFDGGTLEFAIIVVLPAGSSIDGMPILQIGFKSSEYSYTLNEDGESYTAEFIGNRSSIEVPTEYQGKKVTGFKISTGGMSSIVVPEGITDISLNNSTYSQIGISSITIPTTIESVEINTPGSCSFEINFKINLNNINDWLSSKYYDIRYYCSQNSSDYILSFDFYVDGTQVKNIDLEDVTELPEYAFAYADQIQSVTLGEKIEKIGGYAFYGCTSLNSVNFEEKETPWTILSYSGSIAAIITSTEVNDPSKMAQ